MITRVVPHKPFILSLLALTSLLGSGCGETDDHPKVIIGAVIDQTGNNSELSWISAVQLAMVQMNEALAAEGDFKDFRFKLDLQNSENDVVGGPDSRAMVRLRGIAERGAIASILDTTQVAEEANKPSNNYGMAMQCSSCTGGAFLNAATNLPNDLELQASRRNADHWMQRTIMSTGSLAVVIAQMIYGMPNHGDLNGDGIIKLAGYGSDESFGQSSSLAALTELKKKFPAGDRHIRFERILHVNSNDLRDIPFNDHLRKFTDNNNDSWPPADATVNSPNGHLFGVADNELDVAAYDPGHTIPGVQDGPADFIAVATFARNGVQLVNDFETGGFADKGTQIIHFHTFRFSSNLLPLGSLAEGQFGASHVILDGDSGQKFKDGFKQEFGLLPVYRDSIYYDNAVTMMLATLLAFANPQNADVTRESITGAMVRDVFPCTSANAAKNITTRPDLVCPAGDVTEIVPTVESFREAIRVIRAGGAIDYRGASGPVDYDALGNVKTKVASYKVIGGVFQDTASYDCITSAACACTAGSDFGECPSQAP